MADSRAKSKRHYERHREAVLRKQSTWYRENRDVARARQKAYRSTERGKAARARAKKESPEKHALRMAVRRAEVREFVWGYKSTHACIGCGENNPIVLDFDHRDPKEKSFEIGTATRSPKSIEAVKAEIAKCDVRCANCHRIKTWVERNL